MKKISNLNNRRIKVQGWKYNNNKIEVLRITALETLSTPTPTPTPSGRIICEVFTYSSWQVSSQQFPSIVNAVEVPAGNLSGVYGAEWIWWQYQKSGCPYPYTGQYYATIYKTFNIPLVNKISVKLNISVESGAIVMVSTGTSGIIQTIGGDQYASGSGIDLTQYYTPGSTGYIGFKVINYDCYYAGLAAKLVIRRTIVMKNHYILRIHRRRKKIC